MLSPSARKREVDALVAKFAAGDAVDVKLLRKGCLALIDNAQETPAAHAISDARLKIAPCRLPMCGLWDWDLTTDNRVRRSHLFRIPWVSDKEDQFILIKGAW
jgi:hypothetical protein